MAAGSGSANRCFMIPLLCGSGRITRYIAYVIYEELLASRYLNNEIKNRNPTTSWSMNLVNSHDINGTKHRNYLKKKVYSYLKYYSWSLGASELANCV